MQYYMSATVRMSTYDETYQGKENIDEIFRCVRLFNWSYDFLYAEVSYIGDHDGDHMHDVELVVSSKDGTVDSMDEWKGLLFEILCNFGSDWYDVEIWKGDDTVGERVSV